MNAEEKKLFKADYDSGMKIKHLANKYRISERMAVRIAEQYGYIPKREYLKNFIKANNWSDEVLAKGFMLKIETIRKIKNEIAKPN